MNENEGAVAAPDIIQPPKLPVLDQKELANYRAMEVDLKELVDTFAVNVGSSGITEFKLPRIKTPQSGGESFGILDPFTGAERRAKSFQAIILDVRDIRAYWKRAYDETGGVPPDCRSDDCVTGYGDPGGLCGTDSAPICPLAAFGSEEVNGVKKKGQACKHMKQFFLARPGSGNILPEVLNAPPTAISQFTLYTLNLLGQVLKLNGVVTEFRLERAKSGNLEYSRIAFRPVAVLAPEARERFLTYARGIGVIWQRANAKSLITNIQPQPAQLPAPGNMESAPPSEKKEAF
jgi:hypothetical protein